jgi:glyoxylase-like metal-dependent hydrolase (beta-lactamase superfamily II)
MMREASLRGGIELDIDGVEAVALTHLHADHASGTPAASNGPSEGCGLHTNRQGAPRAQRTAGRLRARGCARRC